MTASWKQSELRRENLDSFRMMTVLWPAPKPKRLPTAEVLAEAEWLLGNGVQPWEIAAALNRKQNSLSRLAYRHDRPDLGTALNDRTEAA